MELWAVEFWHPTECKRVIRIFEGQEAAREVLFKYSVFEPVAWEL